MQTSPPTTPKAPSPASGPFTITITGLDGKTHTVRTPTSPGEVEGLRAERHELSSELANVTSRRSDLVEELNTTGNQAARGGLEQRIHLLDQRTLQIESDLAVLSQQIAATPAEVMAGLDANPPQGDDFEEGLFTGGFAVFFAMLVITFFLRRRWLRKGKRTAPEPAADSPRLQRVEQAVEAIAIEVERVSEGQRFVTKLLSEGASPLRASDRLAQPATAEEKS